MNRRQFIKGGIYGLAGTALSGAVNTPVFKVGKACAAPLFSSNAWKFGILGDTQWTLNELGTDGYNDHSYGVINDIDTYSVAKDIIDQVDAKMVELGVKMVIQVGDLTNCGTTRAIQYRADLANTNLLANNIDFFPFRGNHETYGAKYGETTMTDYGVAAMRAAFPQIQGKSSGMVSGSVATNFALASDEVGDECLSYAFDYNNVRIVIIDNWDTGENNQGYMDVSYTQLDWLEDQLKNRTVEHAIVLSHQNLMGENHQDTLFGSTNENTDFQNQFYALMNTYKAQYYIGGHDHIHQRSLIESPDGQSSVEQLICQSCSSKFYTPKAVDDAGWHDQKYRETSVSQEMYAVGFYVFTVEDSIMMVEYYADDVGNWSSGNSYPDGTGSLETPAFNFVKKETWGYSFSDSGVTSFTIAEGDSYSITTPNSSVKVIKTGGTATDYQGRSFEKHAEAWWADKSTENGASSDIITLIGINSGAIPVEGASNDPDDPACVQISYDDSVTPVVTSQSSSIQLCLRNDDGKWINAVDNNFGGTKTFVNGAYDDSYELGTYGIDTEKKVVWAVVNNDGQFAAINTKYSPWSLFLPAILGGAKKD